MSDFQERLKSTVSVRKYDDETLKKEVDRLTARSYQRSAESRLKAIEGKILEEKTIGKAYEEGYVYATPFSFVGTSIKLTAEETEKMEEAKIR